MSSEGEKIVVVDLDGTLAEYEGWTGEWAPIGEPISDVNGWTARDFMLRLQERGYRTIVYSSRGDVPEIVAWLQRHGIPYNGVNGSLTNFAGESGKPPASAYVDDRAVRFAGDYRSALVRVLHLAGDGASPPASAVAPSELWRTSSLPGDESEQELRPTGEGGTAEAEADTEPIELEVSPAGEATLLAHEVADIADVVQTELGDDARMVVAGICQRLDQVRSRIAKLGQRIVELQHDRDDWRQLAESLDDEDVFGNGGQ